MGTTETLLSEIEFLTLFNEAGNLVVYAGAAPGTHIKYLSDLFPEKVFHLWDPAPFTVKPSAKIEIHSGTGGFFTPEVAQSYLGQSALFISDVRSADPHMLEEDETEAQVAKDMTQQMEWHIAMKARASMFKFRLPWKPGTTDYLDGKIYLPVWGPITTTETRLIVDGPQTVDDPCPIKVYNNREYEEKMFTFNTTIRTSLYPHPITNVPGLDHCYDCSSEVHILFEYLTKVKKITEISRLIAEITLMSRQINRQCSPHRTLEDSNPDPAQRKRAITSRQHVGGTPAYLFYSNNRNYSSLNQQPGSSHSPQRSLSLIHI